MEKLPSQGGFKMAQPFLIQRILDEAEIDTSGQNLGTCPQGRQILKHSWRF